MLKVYLFSFYETQLLLFFCPSLSGCLSPLGDEQNRGGWHLRTTGYYGGEVVTSSQIKLFPSEQRDFILYSRVQLESVLYHFANNTRTGKQYSEGKLKNNLINSRTVYNFKSVIAENL